MQGCIRGLCNVHPRSSSTTRHTFLRTCDSRVGLAFSLRNLLNMLRVLSELCIPCSPLSPLPFPMKQCAQAMYRYGDGSHIRSEHRYNRDQRLDGTVHYHLASPPILLSPGYLRRWKREEVRYTAASSKARTVFVLKGGKQLIWLQIPHLSHALSLKIPPLKPNSTTTTS